MRVRVYYKSLSFVYMRLVRRVSCARAVVFRCQKINEISNKIVLFV